MLLQPLVLVVIGVTSSTPGDFRRPNNLRLMLTGIFVTRPEHEPGAGGWPYIWSQVNCGLYSRTMTIKFPLLPFQTSESGS